LVLDVVHAESDIRQDTYGCDNVQPKEERVFEIVNDATIYQNFNHEEDKGHK
jgi:hypothetical protein